MGEMVRLCCRNGDYSKDFSVGGGLRSIDTVLIEKQLLEEDLTEWHQLLERGKVKRAIWEYELGYCPRCNEIEASFKVEIITKDENPIYLGCKCTKCKNVLKLIKKQDEIRCPECGDKSIEVFPVGHWD